MPAKFKLFLKSINSTYLTAVVLVTACIAVFFFQNDLHYFGRGHHAFISSHGMTVARNLSLEHYFLQFENRTVLDDGTIRYKVYGRFPVTAFALIKTVILLADGDLSMEIEMTRNLMNLFFIGSILLVFITLRQLDLAPPACAAVSLLAFSAYYLNYYNDMIFNDSPAMFGLLLAFNGMVMYQKTQKFIPLAVKSILALSLGWQPYAVLLPYILFFTTKRLINERSFTAVVKSNEIKLGLITLAFGIVVLIVNFTSEKIATGSPWGELPSIQKMKYRLGIQDYKEAIQNRITDDTIDEMRQQRLAMGNIFKQQMFRVGRSSVPFLIAPRFGPEKAIQPFDDPFCTTGLVITVAVFAAVVFLKNRLLLLTLFVSGFLWAFSMRNFVYEHDFQSIYYVGVPILLFYLLIRLIYRFAGSWIPLILLASLVIFCGSNLKLNLYKATTADTGNDFTADFQNIKELLEKDNTIFCAENFRSIAGGWHSVEYYLTGILFTETPEPAQFILSRNPRYNDHLLTPYNRRVFLFKNPNFIPRGTSD